MATVHEMLAGEEWRSDCIFPERPRYQHVTFPKNGGRLHHSEGSGEYQISTYHPYDLAEYHWATSRDGDLWQIVRGRRVIAEFTGDADEVFAELKRRDGEVRPQMDHS